MVYSTIGVAHDVVGPLRQSRSGECAYLDASLVASAVKATGRIVVTFIFRSKWSKAVFVNRFVFKFVMQNDLTRLGMV